MDQQTWIIKFIDDSNDGDYQANTLEEFLLNASPEIKVTQKPTTEFSQGGWADLIVPIITSGTAVAVVGAISTWIKSIHGATIDIEIKEFKLKARNITSKNYENTLHEFLKYAQDRSEGKSLE